MEEEKDSAAAVAADGEIEYEALPPTVSMGTHMVAGALAGVMEHCVMYPVDCVKTRMQSLFPDPRAAYRNVFHALRTIVRTEGAWRPVRGVNAMAAGAGPAHALYFACYEHVKASLSGGRNSHLANGLAGCAATLLHDATMNPAEVVKQRLQMYNSPYGGALECARRILRSEGLAAFYRSYPTQLALNLPFQSLHFVAYEACQERLNPRRAYSPGSHVASGAVAGGLAAALTTPLDVCKTLLNTQEMALVEMGVAGAGACAGLSSAASAAEGCRAAAYGAAAAAGKRQQQQPAPSAAAGPTRQPLATLAARTAAAAAAAATAVPAGGPAPAVPAAPPGGAGLSALLGVGAGHLQQQATQATPLRAYRSGERPAPQPTRAPGAAGGATLRAGSAARQQQQQQQHCRPPRYLTGLAMAFRTVYRHGGLPAFFRGTQARVLYQMPSTAIAWSVYEFFKHSLSEH
ncbi:mitoferrin-1-like isoform X1 [Lethenteron reissneri]|uniref:mitoferrin-1-like isoform X1 n=2 Tax=Lethenteron reissneri TaxID=7753 RepID=UPI002AB629D7|nr:mitoferrin-1-like isoform X1 [Lethenteron reissneri]